MKPIETPLHITAYTLVVIDKLSGQIVHPTIHLTEQGDIGHGMYSDMKVCQGQQLILKLHGIDAHIFELHIPI
jgi:hypothetical protein